MPLKLASEFDPYTQQITSAKDPGRSQERDVHLQTLFWWWDFWTINPTPRLLGQDQLVAQLTDQSSCDIPFNHGWLLYSLYDSLYVSAGILPMYILTHILIGS